MLNLPNSCFMPKLKTSQFRGTGKQIQQVVAPIAEKSATVCRIFNSTVWLLLLPQILFGSVPCAAATSAGVSDVTDYHLVVELHPAKHRLVAAAVLTLPQTRHPLRLQLVPQALIESVQCDGQPAKHTFADGTLTIAPPASPREGPRQLTIRYRADFNDPLPQETVGSEDPAFGVSATILPEGTYLSADTPWFPRIEGRRGRHRVEVNAPAGTVAITAGRLNHLETRDGRTASVWENEFPLEGLALAAGNLTVARDELDGIQLLTFLSPDNAALAPAYLAAMRRHLAFYRDLLGPYPYPKFAVVENFLPTGFGLPSWTLLGKSVVRLPFLLDTSLPHEIVHSWWGNAVEVDYAQGNWGEGLTTYLADYLLKERAGPAEARDYRRKILRDYAALVTPQNDFPLTSFHGRMAKYQQAIGYGKGAMVFHMLRREIGDQAFWSALRRMAAEGSGRGLGWHDIERIFSEASRADLRWFFAQWVERSGAPELAFDEIRSLRTAKGWLVSGAIRQTGTSYRLNLPLRLTTAAGDILEQTVRLDGPRTPFTFSAAPPPALLEADPESDLFRRLSPSEVPATINDLLTPKRPLVIVADGQQRLHEAGRDLLKGLHWDAAEIVTEGALSRTSLAGRDLLFLGWPRRRELQPSLPDGLTVAMADNVSTWTVVGEQAGGDTLLAVLAGRDNADGVRAILLSNDPTAAAQAAPKISHYGRFSLLLFNTGRNVVKTTWSSRSSPLRVMFPLGAPP